MSTARVGVVALAAAAYIANMIMHGPYQSAAVAAFVLALLWYTHFYIEGLAVEINSRTLMAASSAIAKCCSRDPAALAGAIIDAWTASYYAIGQGSDLSQNMLHWMSAFSIVITGASMWLTIGTDAFQTACVQLVVTVARYAVPPVSSSQAQWIN